MKRAQYLIDNRVYSREDDWEILFPTLDAEEVPDWMNLLTVIEAAQLVYTLFGPESTAQQSISQKTVDVLLREVPFNLDFNDEMVEDITFSKINDILESDRLTNGVCSSDRLCELSKIISIRLPVDSQIVTAYKEALALLSDYNRQNDTPQKVIHRIKKILAGARREIRSAFKWQHLGLKFSTDKKGYPVAKTFTKGQNPSSSKDVQSSKDICSFGQLW